MMRIESEIWKFIATKSFGEKGMCLSMIFCALVVEKPMHKSARKRYFFMMNRLFFKGIMQSGLRQSFVPRFASAVPFASLGNASCHIFNLSFSILKKTFLPGLLQKASNRNIVGRISQQPINTGY